MQDLISILRGLDPWPLMAGFFAILWAVEVKFGARAKATKQQILDAKLSGYDLAGRHEQEWQEIKAGLELEQEGAK